MTVVLSKKGKGFLQLFSCCYNINMRIKKGKEQVSSYHKPFLQYARTILNPLL